MNILEEIAKKTRERIETEKQWMPESELRRKIEQRKKENKVHPSFYEALKKEGMSYICEVKKASPSKGVIAPEFPYLEIAREYEEAGAAAISCLTEPHYFLGADRYLEEIAENVHIPVLRKDFVVDSYMILQAAAMGASAVLLICAILSEEQLKSYRVLAETLGMDALVEAHDELEVEKALRSGAKIIGVNNRDLRTFEVDVRNSLRYRKMAPKEVLFVSESGIKTSEDISLLYKNHVDAVLIGETLMRSSNKKQTLEQLNRSAHRTKIKICGLRSMEDVRLANEVQPDYAGFIVNFPKSVRSLSEEEVEILAGHLDDGIVSVGVFVNQPMEVPERLLKKGTIDLAQLHGEETSEYIEELQRRTKKQVMKAFRIRTKQDVEEALKSPADFILLDQGYGEGIPFDWSLLPEIDRKFFLAGGISEKNLGEAIESLHPYALDMSSSLETNFRKDPRKVRRIMSILRETEEDAGLCESP